MYSRSTTDQTISNKLIKKNFSWQNKMCLFVEKFKVLDERGSDKWGSTQFIKEVSIKSDIACLIYMLSILYIQHFLLLVTWCNTLSFKFYYQQTGLYFQVFFNNYNYCVDNTPGGAGGCYKGTLGSGIH